MKKNLIIINNYKSFIIYIYFVFLISACDKIDGPFVENNNIADTITCPVPDFPIDTIHERIILLEKFTGHMCGNCPESVQISDSLKQLYEDQLIIYSAHVGYFASVNEPNYTYDFRNEVATDISEHFGNDAAGLPNGMVNRKEFGASLILTCTNWGSAIQQIIDIPPDIDINIINEYNATDRKLCTHIQTIVLNDINGTFNLVVYITEDSIVSYQKDYDSTPADIPDFVHRHALRDAINGTWGTTLTSGTIHADTSVIKSYVYHLNDNWDANQCSIVAFVYNYDTKEILQVAEKHIID
jgi:hypothetical protein